MSINTSDTRRVEHVIAYPLSVWFSKKDVMWYGLPPGIRTGPGPGDFALTVGDPIEAKAFVEFRDAADFARAATVDDDNDQDRELLEQALERARPGSSLERKRTRNSNTRADIIPFPSE